MTEKLFTGTLRINQPRYGIFFLMMFPLILKDLNIFYSYFVWRYSDDVMTSYHRKHVQIMRGVKRVGNENVN